MGSLPILVPKTKRQNCGTNRAAGNQYFMSVHCGQQNGKDGKEKFANSFMGFESSPYVMTGRELKRGLLISFFLGFFVAVFCFALFH